MSVTVTHYFSNCSLLNLEKISGALSFSLNEVLTEMRQLLFSVFYIDQQCSIHILHSFNQGDFPWQQS